VVGVLLSSAVFVLAGTPDSPGAPGVTNSFTLEDIYNRLNAGTAGVQSTFTEPAAGPGTGTMHTLNEIMGKAPAADNTNGATTAQVLTGKTYWGLRTDGTLRGGHERAALRRAATSMGRMGPRRSTSRTASIRERRPQPTIRTWWPAISSAG